MLSKRLRAVLFPSLLLILLLISIVLLLNSLIQRPSVQRYLLAQLSQATGYKLSAREIQLNLWGEIGITASNFEAMSRLGTESIVASRVRIALDAGELLRGRIVPARISILRPAIEIDIENIRGHAMPGASALEDMLMQTLAAFPSVSLKGARICIKDMPFGFDDFYLDVSQKGSDPVTVNIRLKSNIRYKGEEVPFTVQGTISQDANIQENLYAELALKTGKIPLSWMPWHESVPFTKGCAEAQVNFKGALNGSVVAEGKIHAEDLSFSIVESGDIKTFTFDELGLDFMAAFSDLALDISSFEIKASDFSITGRSRLDLRDSLNPHLNIKVETPFMSLQTFERIFPSSLLPQWVENQLFPIFQAGDVRVPCFSLNGTFNKIGNLDLRENAGALFLQIACKDLDAFNNMGGLPFENLSGSLIIENGDLFVSSARGSFGKSHFEDGSLRVTSLYDDTPSFDISADGIFDLQDLVQQANINLVPEDVQNQVRKFRHTSGTLEARFQIDFENGWNHPKILRGEFGFRECSMVHEKLILPLKLYEAEIKVPEQGEGLFRGRGLWGNSGFQASGLWENSLETVKADVVAMADMNELMSFFKVYELPVKFGDPVECRLSLSKRKELLSCQGKINLTGMAMETQSFSMYPPGKENNIVFDLDLHPKKSLYVKKCQCSMGKSVLGLAGSCDLTGDLSTNFEISTNRLSLEDLGIRSNKGDSPAKGILKCQARVNTSLHNPSMTSVTGELDGKGLSFVAGDLPSNIKDCDLSLRFSKNKILVDSLKMSVGHSLIQAHGHLRGWVGARGELTIKADYLDFSDLLANGTVHDFLSKESGTSRFFERSDIHLKLKVLDGVWRDVKYGPLEADCVLRSGDFFLDYCKVRTEHVKITAKCHVKKDREMFLSSHIRMKDQPVKELIRGFGPEYDRLEGLLTLEAVIFAKGRDKKYLISSLTGSANVHVEKGKIIHSKVIYNILDFLSLQGIFKQRPPDLSKEGIYFETIGGHININKGVLETENLVMISPVFNATGKGSVNLNTELVDFGLGIQPLGTIDRLITSVPIVGYILTGEEKSIFVYYFEVSGSILSPVVRYVPLINLGNSTAGFLGRVLLTPARLFDNWSEAIRDLMKIDNSVPDDDFLMSEEEF